MNPTTIDAIIGANNDSDERVAAEQSSAMRELAELELLCVGGGAGDVIF
ncbi:MAG: hypothetical protein JNM76_11345 [Betaproteobacteria bacterium]|nr:hypothetical protein [Betaproteobacteria bacterium]